MLLIHLSTVKRRNKVVVLNSLELQTPLLLLCSVTVPPLPQSSALPQLIIHVAFKLIALDSFFVFSFGCFEKSIIFYLFYGDMSLF